MKKILIILMDEDATFEAHGERFVMVDIPKEFDDREIVNTFQGLVTVAKNFMQLAGSRPTEGT